MIFLFMSHPSLLFKYFPFNRIISRNRIPNQVLLKKSIPHQKYLSSSASDLRNWKKMKFHENPQFISCLTKEVQMLQNMFTENGHEIRIVGGAVRDLLLGIKPEDLDFATTATPDEMKQIFMKNNIRLINSNGEKHGTITARINEKNFEVTTLRIDITTDGRHAEVQFTKNWLYDANRRDLTINSMYLDLNGTLYDYFNGYEDLMNNRICFVGDSTKRIQEDYLRILRYFRFFGKISKEADNHSESVLKGIKDNANGLATISGERIWVELNKIVMGNHVYEILLQIIKLGVGAHIGFPQNCNLTELKRVTDCIKKNELPVKSITILTSLFYTEEELTVFYSRIKPSTFDRNLGYFIMLNNKDFKSDKPIRFYQKFILTEQNTMQAKTYAYELLKYKGDVNTLKELENWKIPTFPINGNMLRSKGVTGRNIGLVLKKLKELWIDQDYETDSENLLEYVPNILANLSPPEKKKNEIKKLQMYFHIFSFLQKFLPTD